MALIKPFAQGTKFYYASISYLSLIKLSQYSKMINKDPVTMVVDLMVLDSADPDYSEVENRLEYRIPQVKTRIVPNMILWPKTDQTTAEAVMEQAKAPETEELLFDTVPDPSDSELTIQSPRMVQAMGLIRNGDKEEVVADYVFPFSVEKMKEADNDPYKIGFQWLTGNVEQFKDYASDE